MGDAAASIKTVSSALGGFRFAALFGALVCAVFGLFMLWAVRHERSKEFGLVDDGANMAGAGANIRVARTEVSATRRGSARSPKSGFGKRTLKR